MRRKTDRFGTEMGWLNVPMPMTLIERLDRWIMAQPERPARSAAVRVIVHRYLAAEERRSAKAG